MIGSAAQNRLIAALLLVPPAAVLLIAASLMPAAAGHGTHTQLGMAPCGFLAATGLPCATCGMTTAFSHAAHAQFLGALTVQPAGTLLALLTAMSVVVLGYAALTGMPLTPLGRAVWRPRVLLGLAAIIVLGWSYTLSIALLV